MKAIVGSFLKLLLISILLFLFGFIYFSIIAQVENNVFPKFKGLYDVLIYLYYVFGWIFFVVILLYRIILIGFKNNHSITLKYLISFVLTIIVGIIAFNFSNYLNKDFESFSLSIPLVLYFVLSSLLMAYLYYRIFKVNDD